MCFVCWVVSLFFSGVEMMEQTVWCFMSAIKGNYNAETISWVSCMCARDKIRVVNLVYVFIISKLIISSFQTFNR